MAREVIVWFLCGIVLSLLPVVFCGYRAWINGVAEWLTAACGRGELLLLGAANYAVGLATLFISETPWGILKASFASCAVVLLFFAGLLFADFTAPGRRPRVTGTRTIVRVSIWVYCISILTALGSIIVQENPW